jgi:hypothetical protein
MSTQKEAAGPGLSSVILIGILIFTLGKMLGLASLVSQPVPVVTKAPDPDSLTPGVVYYHKGGRSGRTVWRAKEEAWKEGTVSVLSLSEVELNQWSSDRLKVEEAPSTEEGAGWTDRLKLNVSPLNFRIVEDKVQLATEVELGDFFDGRTFIYQVMVHFESTPDGVKVVHEDGTLGFAPLGAFPLYGGWVFSMVMDRFEEGPGAEWLSESLADLESVEIADGQMVLRRRAEG